MPAATESYKSPVTLDPFRRIWNVGWGGKFNVQISAGGAYPGGAGGSLTAQVILTEVGKRAGGKIISQENIQSPTAMQFIADIEFSRALFDAEPWFIIKLAGSTGVPDQPGTPPPLVPEFCGTTTTTYSLTDIYTTPNPYTGGLLYWQDSNWTTTTPAGTSSASMTWGPLRGGAELQPGKGSYSSTTRSESIWYQDGFGNWVDTGLPCDNLPPPGTPPKTEGTRVRGFNGIALSTVGATSGAQVEIPRRLVGLNSDFEPIFDDLPAGDYAFSMVAMEFPTIPHAKPGQPDKAYFPVSLSERYSAIIFTPSGPSGAFGWEAPREYIPGTIPPNAYEIPHYFPPGAPPPANQVYVPAP